MLFVSGVPLMDFQLRQKIINDGVVKWLRPQSAKLSDPKGREFKSHRHLQTFNVLVNVMTPRATK